MSVDWVGYGYAAVIASGGLVGYVKARKYFTVNLKIDTSVKYVVNLGFVCYGFSMVRI